ncbi:MAG: hypothetical protein ACERKK_02100 [Poseidonibacter sp.]|uniref:hypothetical protein n=1 Tax=Poseidonibacter sp. TaxID=2321188 RepID=UPI00359E6301
MAIRCEDEFNPWPSFVDIFSSVILVMLLFLLVLLVNLGYYSQFKYKVSYTGSISSDELILNSNPSPLAKTISVESITSVPLLQKEVLKLRKIIEQKEVKAKEKEESEVISGGIDVSDVKDDDKLSKQVLLENEDYLLVTFKGTEIFLDNQIMKQIKVFVQSTRSKYKDHKLLINAYDVKGQVSATVTKQISLARSIGARNLIRKMGYEKKDVRIDLLSNIKIKEKIDETNGYLIIRVKK